MQCPLLRLVAGAIALVAVGGVPAGAQERATTADLSGVVFDQSRAVLPGVTVRATNTATGIDRAVVTGPEGRYALPALPPGVYLLSAALAGFTPARADNVVLLLGQLAERDFTLQVAGTAEAVTVEAASPLADVRRTAVASVVSQQQIDALPTNGRNFISFSVITPGVNTDRTPTQGANATSGLTFAGQRARSNNITVDGLDNNDLATGGVRATFSQEAVDQFQVVTNSASAEFGKASGGVVNIVTKSGGNTFAGNVFGFFRDDALNAKEHFEKFLPDGTAIDQPKAPYSRSQFGGTLGGPIRRNRSFFFLSAERLRMRANNFVNIDSAVAAILVTDGFPVELGQVPYRVEADQVLAKADSWLASSHHLAVRFNWADLLDENGEPWGGQVARSRGASIQSRDLMGAASLTSIFSSRTLNELRLLVAYRNQKVLSLDESKCDGVCDQDNEGGPSVEIGDIKVGRQIFTPQFRQTLQYQLVDTISRVIGRQHQVKAGVDWSYVDYRKQSLPMAFGGRYIFSSVQALAAGSPAMYGQGYGNPSAVGPASSVSLFAEDNWRVRERLTLKLGLRYQNQFFPALTETVYGLTYDWPADNNNVAPRVAAAWSPFGSGKTSVSGAYGLFYDNQISATWSVPAIMRGTAEHVRIKQTPFPDSREGWNASGRRLPEPSTPYASLMVTIDPRLKTPYAHHAALGLDQLLGGGFGLSAHFLLVRGFDQMGIVEYNPVINGLRPLNAVVGSATASVQQYTSWGQSWYRGLTLSLRKRFGARSEFLAAYTWSRAEDLAADYAFSQPQNNGQGRDPADPMGLPLGFDPMLERGASLQDERHRFVLSGMYELPWRLSVSGIVTVGSGRPFNILAGQDLNADGDPLSDRPWTVKNDPSTRIRRNTGLLPGTSSVDLRVAKQIVLGARAKLDLMIEMFNVLNHTNYTQADAVFGNGVYPSSPTNPLFGRYTKASPPFQAQLGAKVQF